MKTIPVLIETDEWLYKGCFIQKQAVHPKLGGRFEIFKNNTSQTHVGRTYTYVEAKKLCENNECFDNTLKF